MLWRSRYHPPPLLGASHLLNNAWSRFAQTNAQRYPVRRLVMLGTNVELWGRNWELAHPWIPER